MRKSHAPGLVLCLFLVIPGTGVAEQPHSHDAPRATMSLDLSPELLQLLQQEMAAIQAGMQSLVPDIAAGNWAGAAQTGENIQSSYIFNKKLTQAQREELQQKLPPAFRELDQSLHHAAGMLAHAATMKNADVVNFYFYKLVDGCVSCHAKFASHRFPGFSANSVEPGDGH
jgi:hypothetical protein